jgi:hypothetical protein
MDDMRRVAEISDAYGASDVVAATAGKMHPKDLLILQDIFR